MNVYDLIMSPFEANFFTDIRSSIVSPASGTVLEIGIGTGANLKYYQTAQMKDFIGTDLRLSNEIIDKAGDRIKLLESSVENLPFKSETFDYVVETLVFCTVKDVDKSISEVLRVLKPGGKFAFIEHVKPPDKNFGKIFDALNPAWHKVASGCNINRDALKNIKEAGFNIEWEKSAGKGIFVYGIAQKPLV